MKTIYRYPIALEQEQEITINALKEYDRFVSSKKQILKIDTIRNTPSMWCLVDTDLPKVKVKLHLYGTGWPMPDEIENLHYVDSFILSEYGEIYHAFIK